MPNNKEREIIKKPTQRYKPPPAEAPPEYSVEMSCPLCGRRACDLSDYPNAPMWVGMKCPHCHNIIHLNIKR